MKRPGIMAAMTALVLATTVSGCGGGGAKSQTQTDVRTTTTGQELLDLQKAYEAGAMSKNEYEKQKKKILQRK